MRPRTIAGDQTLLAAHLPRELADKEVLREKVKQAMDDLASQERHKRINLTDRDARLMKGRQGIVGWLINAQYGLTRGDGWGRDRHVGASTRWTVVDECQP